MGLNMRKPVFGGGGGGGGEGGNITSASAQSDQCLFYLRFGRKHI